MRIYLVGFMGVGKSTAGRALAQKLNCAFADLDEMVEQEEQRSIREIFDEHGEAFFRARERMMLARTFNEPDVVIATGGGTFVFEENRALISNAGVSVHLNAPFDLIAARVRTKAGERPLFRDEKSAFDLFRARQPHYRLADVTIDVASSETPREIAERIILALPRDAGRARTAR